MRVEMNCTEQTRIANGYESHAALAAIVGQCVSPTHTWRKSDCTDKLNAATFQLSSPDFCAARRPGKANAAHAASSEATNGYRCRRDALAFLGLLSSLYLRFDPPIGSADGGAAQPTHFQGLNIHALIIDNVDGEVLALEHNQIHAHQSPVEHAEQRALRMAITRIGAKRPRAPATTVEDYYRAQMFYDGGGEAADFLHRGATIYTSLEPCPMCATTILVCRVKRTVFLLQDTTYGGVWVSAKTQYYQKNDLSYGQLNLSDVGCPFITSVRDLHQKMSRRVEGIRKDKVIDTLIFDHLTEDLQAGFKLFCQVTPDNLASPGDHNATNRRTLDDLRRMCNVPTCVYRKIRPCNIGDEDRRGQIAM
jgi:tRNA(Arg) A34 adenosine deaminase TadA